MPAHWTDPQVTTHAVGPWSLPQATAWRQATPSDAESDDGDGDGGDALPATPLAASTLATWLQDSGRSASLHFVVEIGANQPGAAWIGLSRRAETPDAADRALAAATEDLGALLDAWDWFVHDSPVAPDVEDGPALGLADDTDDPQGLLDANHAWMTPALPMVLARMATRPGRLRLQLTVTPAVGDPALVRAAEAAARRAVSNDERMALWDSSPLTTEALRLHGQVTASLLQVRLTGTPLPGRAVHTWIAGALSSDLAAGLRFDPLDEDPEGPQGAPSLLLHGSRVQRILEVLTSAGDGSLPPAAD